jgi:CBS domain-containing protein
MTSVWALAALWLGLAMVSTLLSIWLRVATALSEIVVGMVAQLIIGAAVGGAALGTDESWIKFLSGTGAIVLTFLAGAELDPTVFRRRWKEASLIGAVGFFAPFLGCTAIAYFLLGWSATASWLVGVALSTTSVAVVYAVMLESGLSRTDFGKVILAACFINDLGTVLALGLIFAPFTVRTLAFVGIAVVVFVVLSWLTPRFFRRYRDRPSELEAKYLLLVLFGLGALASWADSEAVLPAYIVGMLLAGTVGKDHVLVRLHPGASGRAWHLRRPLPRQDDHQDSRRLPDDEAGALSGARGALHDAPHVDRPHLRQHLRAFRPVAPHHHPGTVFPRGGDGDRQRGGADAHRQRVLPSAASLAAGGTEPVESIVVDELEEVGMRGKRMVMYLGQADLWNHRPLHLAILELLKKEGCAGATAIHGIAGYAGSASIKTSTLEVTSDLPVIVTAVDTPEHIAALLPQITAMLSGGLVTVEDVDIAYSAGLFGVGFPRRRVAEVMSKNPDHAAPDTPLADVVRRLLDRDYTALPVVDADGRVVGIIDEADLLDKGLTDLSLSLHKVIGAPLVADYLARLGAQGLTVSSAMRATVTVRDDSSLRDAAHVMHSRNLKRVPVVDAAGKLVGVLGRLDILSSLAAGHAAPVPHHDGSLPARHASVRDIMETGVPTVTEEVPLTDVLDKLLDAGLKRVVVVDVVGPEGRPVGIITDTDLVARVDPEDRPGFLTLMRSRWNAEARQRVRRARGQRAGDVMSRPVITVRDTATVGEALALTVTRHIKRLPVVDGNGRLVGMASRPALLAASLDVAAASR